VSPIRLSICIPVHNFGAFLGATLESIVRQATDETEIVVLDGGSTDDTPQVVETFQRRFSRLRYCRLPRRGGIDRDMARTVEQASGEYCWLFSGDDLMREGAVSRVLAELPSGCDVYLLESMLCDLEMRPLARHRMVDVQEARTFRLHDPAERSEYFERSLDTAAFFSFCSSLVVRKARWDAAPVDESWYGSCWAHAARILGMIPQGLVVRVLPGAFLDKRGENDSFLTNGLAHRYGIGVEGYNRIADAFFGHGSREAALIRRALRAEIPWYGWLAARLEIATAGRREQVAMYHRLVGLQYSDPSPANLAALALCRLTPVPALRGLKWAMDAWKRLRPGARRASGSGGASPV